VPGSLETVVVFGADAVTGVRGVSVFLVFRLEEAMRMQLRGGVHLELAGDAVTECLGGSEGLDEDEQ
jgi:3-deoxy-D-arabino-heptulosonate 7-phosphate (DAHP) synthase class II